MNKQSLVEPSTSHEALLMLLDNGMKIEMVIAQHPGSLYKIQEALKVNTTDAHIKFNKQFFARLQGTVDKFTPADRRELKKMASKATKELRDEVEVWRNDIRFCPDCERIGEYGWWHYVVCEEHRLAELSFSMKNKQLLQLKQGWEAEKGLVISKVIERAETRLDARYCISLYLSTKLANSSEKGINDADDDMFRLFVSSLVEHILRRYTMLSVIEAMYVVDKGFKGEYGTNYNKITEETVNGWFKVYCERAGIKVNGTMKEDKEPAPAEPKGDVARLLSTFLSGKVS